MMMRFLWVASLAILAGCAVAQPASEFLLIDRDEYRDRIHGMWLGQCVGNWTGLATEGARQGRDDDGDGRPDKPFYTDEDWGTRPDETRPRIDVANPGVWLADDDTDIEYVYLHAMKEKGSVRLTAEDIVAAWTNHVEGHVWGSNSRMLQIMPRGVVPPETSVGQANLGFLFIDAQLTTEMFGALAPGQPGMALRISHLPIRTTASGNAAYAAQFHVLLYALAPCVDPGLERREQILWLVRTARSYLPPGSKSSGIIDFVVADYLANPDKDDWERTRDRLYERYQRDARANGFFYVEWFESSINLGTAVMALVYGEGNVEKTLRIGTLAGWDCDNGTATMAGLLGMMLGHKQLSAELGREFSDRYNSHRTRVNLPDYLPDDDRAEDTLLGMTLTMIPMVERTIRESGGRIDRENNCYLIPWPVPGQTLEVNPVWLEYRRSVNNQIRECGGTVAVTSNVESESVEDIEYRRDVTVVADGHEMDASGRDITDFPKNFSTWRSTARVPVPEFELRYSLPVRAEAVRFIEGDAYPPRGGWFETLSLELLVGDEWIDWVGRYSFSQPLDAERPFQMIDLVLAEPALIRGVRVKGRAGGEEQFVTLAEIDVLGRVLVEERGPQAVDGADPVCQE